MNTHYIITVKKNKGKGLGKIMRLSIDHDALTVRINHQQKGAFIIDETHHGSITQLLDTGIYTPLRKSDRDAVKRHTGKEYDFIRKADAAKAQAKRDKARRESRQQARKLKQDKQNHDSTITIAEPRGKIAPLHHPAKRPPQRVILPHSSEEIPVPPNLQITPMLTLIREHRDKTHRVTVTHDLHFLYEATLYKTLTEISWKAANYQISGNAFFGLPSKKRQPSQ